jgi:hypothetical protein
MIEDIWKVGGGIVGVVLVVWILSEIVSLSPSAFSDFTLNIMGTILVLLVPTGIVVLWKWTN